MSPEFRPRHISPGLGAVELPPGVPLGCRLIAVAKLGRTACRYLKNYLNRSSKLISDYSPVWLSRHARST